MSDLIIQKDETMDAKREPGNIIFNVGEPQEEVLRIEPGGKFFIRGVEVLRDSKEGENIREALALFVSEAGCQCKELRAEVERLKEELLTQTLCGGTPEQMTTVINENKILRADVERLRIMSVSKEEAMDIYGIISSRIGFGDDIPVYTHAAVKRWMKQLKM